MMRHVPAPRNPPKEDTEGALKIIQITDPHLGPFMPIWKLRRICDGIVAQDPDIVLLTGDFYTAECSAPGMLAKALEPLKAMQGRVFACLGNHDKESRAVRDMTETDLKAVGAELLVDEQQVVNTRVGMARIIGLDYLRAASPTRPRTNIATHYAEVFKRLDANQGAQFCPFTVVMLHDPGSFAETIPQHVGGVVFSGHTHGGMVGCKSCGWEKSLMSCFTTIPDMGFYGFGNNRLYVHRGQGSRFMLGNFLLRLGVPPELSIIYQKPAKQRSEPAEI